jgi:hypothetical protein
MSMFNKIKNTEDPAAFMSKMLTAVENTPQLKQMMALATQNTPKVDQVD